MHQINVFRPLFDIFVYKTQLYLAYQAGDIDFFEVKNFEADDLPRMRTSFSIMKQLTVSQIRDVRKN